MSLKGKGTEMAYRIEIREPGGEWQKHYPPRPRQVSTREPLGIVKLLVDTKRELAEMRGDGTEYRVVRVKADGPTGAVIY